MLDPHFLRNHLDLVTEKLAHRGFIVDRERLTELESARKHCQVETQALQANVIAMQKPLVKPRLRVKRLPRCWKRARLWVKNSKPMKTNWKPSKRNCMIY